MEDSHWHNFVLPWTTPTDPPHLTLFLPWEPGQALKSAFGGGEMYLAWSRRGRDSASLCHCEGCGWLSVNSEERPQLPA